MEAIQRKVCLILVFLTAALLAFLLILFCLQTYINQQAGFLRDSVLAKEKEFQEAQFEGFKKVIAQTNQGLSFVNSAWQKQLLLVPVFEELAGLAGESIYLTSSSFQKEEGAGAGFLSQVNVKGIASSREVLFQFKKALENSSQFSAVYFQPHSWVKPVEPEFSLSFQIQ